MKKICAGFKNGWLVGCLILLVLGIGQEKCWAYEEQIKTLSASLAEGIEAAGIKKVAVFDFTDLQGEASELGRFIAEELSVALANAGGQFTVVDRTHVNTILEEHKLSSDGLIDRATARKLGQIEGVEALVTGTITDFGDKFRLAIKVLDTEKATIFVAKTIDLPNSQILTELAGRNVETSIGGSKEIEIEPKEGMGKDDRWKIKVVGLEIIKNGNVRVDVIHTSLHYSGHTFALYRPSENVFLTDEKGNRYAAIGEEGIASVNERRGKAEGTRFPANVGIKYSLIFPPFKERPKSLNLVVQYRGGLGEPRGKYGLDTRIYETTITNIRVK